jgi:hypothetical protein
MDPTEKLVKDHLEFRGYKDIVYEPDGNIPPDLLVDGAIAIEVRRLNQNSTNDDDPDGKRRGLEEVAIPLWNKIKKLAVSCGAPVGGESWFVFFRFTRPVEPWKTLESKVRSALIAFSQSPNKEKGSIVAGDGFELDVFRAGNPRPTMFVMAGCSDRESGGWLLAEMADNIRYCAREKSRKIAKVKSKYAVWWLALVDHVGYGLDDFDRQMFRDQVSIEHDWGKIVIIDPRDPTRWFEV